MEIYGTIEARNTINGALGVGGVSGGGSCDFDTKIIPYDNRITANTNNITALQTEVASLDSITESLTDDVNENIRDIETLEANKADKSEIPNVPSWAMQSNKPSYNASEIANNSIVTGQTVKDAFDTLHEDLDTVATETATNTTNIATNTSDINQINQNLAKTTLHSKTVTKTYTNEYWAGVYYNLIDVSNDIPSGASLINVAIVGGYEITSIMIKDTQNFICISPVKSTDRVQSFILWYITN